MSGYRRRGALIAALLGFFIVMLDTTVVNVALARIGGDLGAPVASLQWVVDAYALTFAALQLSAGAACDRMGARSVHLLGALLSGDWGVADASSERERAQASGIVSAYLTWHLERRLRSLSLVERA